MRSLFIVTLATALCACGDVEDTPNPSTGAGGSGGNMMRYRDAGVNPRRDMRVPNRMDAGTQDMGGAGGASGDPELVYIAGEYTPYGECPDNIDYAGQVLGGSADVPNGGTVRTESYPSGYDSGLRTLMNYVPASAGSDDPDPVDVDVQLTGVTIVATRPSSEGNISESQGQFWISDAGGSIQVYLDLNAASVPNFPIRVGGVLSMRVTRVGRYGGRPQIRAATDWAAVDEAPHPELRAAPDAEVHLLTPDRELTVQDINRPIRLTGLLDGEPLSCGSQHTCWQVNYGAGNITLRTRDTDLRTGTCITFTGPLSAFRENLQLEPFNPLWTRRYQKGAAFGEMCVRDSDCTTNKCVTLGEEQICSLTCATDMDCPNRYSCQFDTCLPSLGSDCPDEVSFTGQIAGPDAVRPNGGTPRFEPYPADYDAGVRLLISRLPETTVDGDPEPIVVDMPISRATVVATRGFTEEDVPESQRSFWIADANGVVEVYLDAGARGGTPNFVVQVGTVLSFRATRIGRYQRKSQISAGTDWVEHGANEPPHPELAAGPNAEVYIWSPDRELTQADSHRIVRITGQLDGTPEGCGSGNKCWRLNYGFGEPVIFRTAHEEAGTGQCVTYVGPVGFYRGNLQFDTTNLSWLRVYN